MKFSNAFLDDTLRLKNRLTKSGLTLLAALLFVYFWRFGPLLEAQPVLQLAGGESHFLKPILIDGPRRSENVFGVIDDEEAEDAYFKVLNWFRPTQYPQYGLTGEPKYNHALDKELGHRILRRAKTLYGDAWRYELKTTLDMFYVELHQHGQLRQLYFETTKLNDDIKGYAGPIKLALLVSPDAHVHELRYLGSDETPSYMEKISSYGFYEQFRALPLHDRHEVDAVSGATLSTQAMARSVNRLVELAADYPLADFSEGDVASFGVVAQLSGIWVLHSAVIALMFVFVAQKYWRKSRKSMTVFQVVTVLYLGVLLNNSFTWISFMHPFMGVGVSASLALYSALVLWGAIWNGNSYCKHVCPFGNIQKLLLRVQPWHLPLPLKARQLDILRGILTLVLAAGILLGLREWSSYEVFPDLFSLNLAAAWFWAALLVVVLSSVWPMLWCRALCPTGAVLDGVTLLSQRKFLKGRKVIPIIPA